MICVTINIQWQLLVISFAYQNNMFLLNDSIYHSQIQIKYWNLQFLRNNKAKIDSICLKINIQWYMPLFRMLCMFNYFDFIGSHVFTLLIFAQHSINLINRLLWMYFNGDKLHTINENKLFNERILIGIALETGTNSKRSYLIPVINTMWLILIFHTRIETTLLTCMWWRWRRCQNYRVLWQKLLAVGIRKRWTAVPIAIDEQWQIGVKFFEIRNSKLSDHFNWLYTGN